MEQFAFIAMEIVLKPYKVGYCRSTIKIHGAMFVLTAALQKAVPMWSAINWDLLVHPHFLQLGRQGLFLQTHTYTINALYNCIQSMVVIFRPISFSQTLTCRVGKVFQACVVEL